jgi:hypothetical protein
MGDASFGKLVNGLRNNTMLREINFAGCGLTARPKHSSTSHPNLSRFQSLKQANISQNSRQAEKPTSVSHSTRPLFSSP